MCNFNKSLTLAEIGLLVQSLPSFSKSLMSPCVSLGEPYRRFDFYGLHIQRLSAFTRQCLLAQIGSFFQTSQGRSPYRELKESSSSPSLRMPPLFSCY
jgi:hypothetical protein